MNDKNVLPIDAIKALKNRFKDRDRILVVCVADYTDLALGLGETKLGMSVFACSSASMAQAHAQASRMGHAAGALSVDGTCGVDFERMLGMTGRAWSRQADWGFRYLEIHALSKGLDDVEVGVYFASGDLGKARPDLVPCAQRLRNLMFMYGVESSEPIGTLWTKQETSTLAQPWNHHQFWKWLAVCAQLGQSAGDRLN
jgi:hypothetical protein